MSTNQSVAEFFASKPPLDRLLFTTLEHRSFPLVGQVVAAAGEVWVLRWPMVDLVGGGLILPSGRVRLEDSLVEPKS